METVEDRFWSKVECSTVDECWEWQAGKFPSGYGAFGAHGKTWRVHRLAYLLEVGSIAQGYHIHHKCDNVACVNPFHLTALPVKDHVYLGNAPSAQNARKTHCKNGHPLMGENLIIRNGNRVCRTCYNEYIRRYLRASRMPKRG